MPHSSPTGQRAFARNGVVARTRVAGGWLALVAAAHLLVACRASNHGATSRGAAESNEPAVKVCHSLREPKTSAIRGAPLDVPRGSAACALWDFVCAAASRDQRANLRDGKIAYAEWNGQRLIVFDPAFEPDCERRLWIARWLQRQISTSLPDPNEHRYFREHSREVAAALEKIWPIINDQECPIADGAFWEETWSILTSDDVDSASVAPIVASEIRRNGLSSHVAFVFSCRRDLNLDGFVRRELREPKYRDDVSARIYGLTILARNDRRIAAAELARLARRADLTPTEARTIGVLRGKIRRGEPFEFGDVEELEYANERR